MNTSNATSFWLGQGNDEGFGWSLAIMAACRLLWTMPYLASVARLHLMPIPVAVSCIAFACIHVVWILLGLWSYRGLLTAREAMPAVPVLGGFWAVLLVTWKCAWFNINRPMLDGDGFMMGVIFGFVVPVIVGVLQGSPLSAHIVSLLQAACMGVTAMCVMSDAAEHFGAFGIAALLVYNTLILVAFTSVLVMFPPSWSRCLLGILMQEGVFFIVFGLWWVRWYRNTTHAVAAASSLTTDDVSSVSSKGEEDVP